MTFWVALKRMKAGRLTSNWLLGNFCVSLRKEHGDLTQDGNSGGGQKWVELECILEIDPTG